MNDFINRKKIQKRAIETHVHISIDELNKSNSERKK